MLGPITRRVPAEYVRAAAAGIPAVVTLLLYLNALRGPFVYDDHQMVVENLSIRDLTDLRAIFLLLPTRPLLNFSHAVEYAFWGLDPFGYHLTNVVLHVLNVVLLFRVAVALESDRDRPLTDRPRLRPEVIGFVAATLFAVHPLMTSAVSYVSGRNEVLCATLFLGALLAARQHLLGSGRRWWVLSAACWLGAIATKEIGAMFPLVLMAYVRFVRRFTPEERRRAILIMLVPFLYFGAGIATARLATFAVVEYDAVQPHWPFLLVELNVIVRYVTMLLRPGGQAIFHAVSSDYPPPADTMLSAAILLLMIAIAWRWRHRQGLTTFGIAWFLLLLVPSTILVVMNRAEPMAEHRVYLASCGLFLVAGTFISWILSLALVTRRRVRYAFVALLGAEIALLAAGSYVRNIMWSDPVQLWLEAVARAPDAWQPRVGLGQAYHEAGQRRRAIEEYTRATELNPGFELSYQRVALLHLEQGEREQARQAFDRLRQRHPHSAVALNGLGAIAMFSGEPDVARIYFGESIGHNPTDVVARQSLASLVEDTDPAEALQLCEEIQRIAPRTPGNDDCIVRNRARLNGSSATVK